MISFIIGFVIGGLFGVVLMAINYSGRDTEDRK